jgi:hypothetical protein
MTEKHGQELTDKQPKGEKEHPREVEAVTLTTMTVAGSSRKSSSLSVLMST